MRAACPLLAEAAATIGHYAIRQRGTLGGSLAHADPAAQMPLIASTLGARIEVVGPDGTPRSCSGRVPDRGDDDSARTPRKSSSRAFSHLHAGERIRVRNFQPSPRRFRDRGLRGNRGRGGGRFAHLRIGMGGVADVPLVLNLWPPGSSANRPMPRLSSASPRGRRRISNYTIKQTSVPRIGENWSRC